MVMVLLTCKETNSSFVVANTHLYWNPEREDIKVMQALGSFEVDRHYVCRPINGIYVSSI